MFQNNLLLAAASSGKNEVACELLDTDTNSGSSATYTISSADLGVAATDRQIVYCYSGRDASEYGSITSVTVGGTGLTHVVSHTKGGASGYRTETWAGLIPTGTSADIVITQTANCFDTASTWFRMTGAKAVATYTATSPATAATGAISASIDCDANGVIIGSAQCNAGFPFSWTNLTERSDLNNGTPDGSTSMDTFADAQSSLSITCTPTGTNPSRAMTLASWSASTGFMEATGGTETTDGDYKVHTFNSSGTFTVQAVGSLAVVEYLVIAGGGGGGKGNTPNSYGCGGAGAGGYLTATDFTVTAQAYTITVGAGGAGATSDNSNGSTGSDSTFSTITTDGGGSGAAGGTATGVGGDGGSGGGGAKGTTGGTGTAGPPRQGYDGGDGSGASTNHQAGGGGASEVGEDTPAAPATAGGQGGDGLASSITGASVTRGGGGSGTSTPGPATAGGAGGGGTGAIANTTPGTDGTANTGGGGGAGGSGAVPGRTGGSGVVIIRYKFQ